MSKKTVAAYILLFMVNAASSLFYTPYLLKTLGSEAYAYYPLSAGLISFASVITVIFTSVLSVFLIEDLTRKDFSKVNGFINSSLFSNAATVLIITVPALLISFYTDKLIKVPKSIAFDVRILFILVTISFGVSQLKNSFMAIALASGNKYLNNSQKAFEKALIIAIPPVLFVFFKPSLKILGIALLTACIVRFYLTVRSAKKIFPDILISGKYVKKSIVKKLFVAGIGNTATQLIFLISQNLSILLSNILFGPGTMTACSIGSLLPRQLTLLFIYMMNSFMFFFAVLFKNNDYENLKKDTLSALKVISVLLGITAGIFIVFGDVFLKLWIPVHYKRSMYIFLLLHIVSFMINGSFYVIYSTIVVYNRVKLPAVFMVITGIAAIPLTVMLAKLTNSIYSASVSQLITGVIQYALFMPIYFSKRTNMDKALPYRMFQKGIYSFLITGAISQSIRFLFRINSFFKLFAVILPALILSLFISGFLFIKRADIGLVGRIIKANTKYRNDLNGLQGSDYDSLF